MLLDMATPCLKHLFMALVMVPFSKGFWAAAKEVCKESSFITM